MAPKRSALDKRILKALGFVARDMDWNDVDVDALRVELKARGVVESLDRVGALARVLECGPLDAVMAVLEAGASVNPTSEDEDHPTPSAATVVNWTNSWLTLTQQGTLLDELRSRGADLDAVGVNDGENWEASALDVAMFNERIELTDWLLSQPLTQQTLASAVRRASRAWVMGVKGASERLAKVLEKLERPHPPGETRSFP
jgi:hypothetical protein